MENDFGGCAGLRSALQQGDLVMAAARAEVVLSVQRGML